MKINIKHIFAALVCIFFVACNVITVHASENIPEDYNKIAQTSKLSLYYSDKNASIIVKDSSNNYLWKSYVSSEQFDSSKLNSQWKGNIHSLFNLSYTDFSNSNGAIVSTSCVDQNPKIVRKDIKNGISLNYNFSDLKISLSLDITLEDDALNVSIPADSIKEEGKKGLVSVEIMPFFGSAKDNQDGYIFYPDGSGALLDLNDTSHYGMKKKSFSMYGIDMLDYLAGLPKNNVMMPVFGVKQGENAFVAAITEGEADAAINLTPTGNVVDVNRIAAEFTYRRYSIDPRIKKIAVRQYDKKIMKADHSVKYFMLNGDKADYSGMANAYRDYLLSSKNAIKRINSSDKVPLGVDLFMGINEKGLLFDKFIPMTTFSEAETIMGKIKGSGVSSLQTNLIGWTKNGYGTEPIQLPPNGKLGGSAGLEKLSNYAKKNNIELFLQDNLIDAIDKNGGFSKRNDVVYQGNGIVATDEKKENFIFCPAVANNNFVKSLLPKTKKLSVGGIDFEAMGNFVYYDYNKKNPSTKQQTVNYWSEMMSKSDKELGKSAADGGNVYVLKNAYRLNNIPDSGSGYYISSEEIPFYQIVVHGIVPYSSQPGNLSHDFAKEKLKWVEYGYMPYFELTYKPSGDLKYTDYNELFTSEYNDWVNTASKCYEEFNQRLGDVWSQYIVHHDKVQEDVYCVTYENGTKIYINYNSEAVTVNGYNIKALDYLVVEKGGVTK